jgi:hypothetical protein
MRNSRRIFALAALSLGLAACTGSLSTGGLSLAPSAQTSLQQIGAFTIADLQNADHIALGQNPPDQLADTCYRGLITFVQTQQAAVGAAAGNTVSGAFSAFETARITAQFGNTAISKATIQPLEVACAPLVQDTINDQTQFLASLASLGKL